MTSTRDDTMAFYRDNAETYAARDRQPPTDRLAAFIARLSPGAAVLDLGCGGGHDSLHLIEAGLEVTPCDGSAELARAAERRIGRKVEIVTFQDIEWSQRFDAIWAEASLLHVPRTELPDVLVRVHRALRPGGLLQASFKAGEREGHDRFGRYFNYPSAAWLRTCFEWAGWSNIHIEEADGGGYDNQPTRWLHVTATADHATPRSGLLPSCARRRTLRASVSTIDRKMKGPRVQEDCTARSNCRFARLLPVSLNPIRFKDKNLRPFKVRQRRLRV